MAPFLPTSTSAPPASSSSATSGNSKYFSGLTLDQVIALAVGVPAVLLSLVAIEYARRNNALQKMKMFMKQRPPVNGQGAGQARNVGGYNGWHVQREPYNTGYAGPGGAYY